VINSNVAIALQVAARSQKSNSAAQIASKMDTIKWVSNWISAAFCIISRTVDFVLFEVAKGKSEKLAEEWGGELRVSFVSSVLSVPN